jgi:5-methylcytosine-specific restriction endonuclease McrA
MSYNNPILNDLYAKRNMSHCKGLLRASSSKTDAITLNANDFLKIVNIHIPDIQRELDIKWTDNLRHLILSKHNTYGYLDLGIFDIGYLNDNFYLINGQHRYYILSSLPNYQSLDLTIHIHEVNSLEEMHSVFESVNGSKPVKLCKTSKAQVIYNGLRKHINNKYNRYVSTKNNPHKPNINLDNMVTKLDEKDFVNKLDLKNIDDIINLFEEINNFYKHSGFIDWKSWIDRSDFMLNKVSEKGGAYPLYLGIYGETHEWIDRIMKNVLSGEDYNEMNHLSYSKRKHIPKRLKTKVWEKSVTQNNQKCYTCDVYLNSFLEFECGHKLSVLYGGQNTLENLEAVCSICNKDMGVEDMDTYKQREYGDS